MRRESHVRIWESGGVRFPSATRLSEGLCLGQQCPLVDSRYLTFYNTRRPHSSLDRKTPDQAYFNQPLLAAA